MSTIVQQPRTIDCGGGIVHQQHAFTIEVARHGSRWGVACTACEGGWWSDDAGYPITEHSRSRAEQMIPLHNRFEHRERVGR